MDHAYPRLGYGNASIQHLLWRSGVAMIIAVYTKFGIGSFLSNKKMTNFSLSG
jgi:hypothetical protein